MAMVYLHSHVHTDIVDNSVITNVTDGGTVGFFPIFADKGKENELVLIDSGVATFVDTYGTDGNKFGQAQLNVRQWLLGGGSAYVMRLLPDDATFAASAVIVNVDSYMPIYKLTIGLKKFDGSGEDYGDENAKQTYLIKEDFIFDGSTVKELVLNRFDRRNVDIKNYVSIFRTGRGESAESSYDRAEDWMRSNDKVILKKEKDLSETELAEYEKTGELPVKSYIDYSLVSDADSFKNVLKLGTKALSPKAGKAVIESLKLLPDVGKNLAIAFEYNGTKDFVFTLADAEVIYNAEWDTTNKKVVFKHPTTGVVTEEANVKFAKLTDYSVKGTEYDDEDNDVVFYKKGTDPVYIINTSNITYNTEADNFVSAYSPLTEAEGEKSYEPHEFALSGLKFAAGKNLVDMVLALPTADFGDDEDENNPNTCKGIKEALFEDADSINAYFSFADTIVKDPADNEHPLSDFIFTEVKDLATDTQYFLDSYPIEVFSIYYPKAETKKIWNAKIVVTDSDGVSREIVIFKNTNDTGKTPFKTESIVYYALNALSNYAGSIIESKKYKKFIQKKGQINVYEDDEFTNGDYGTEAGETFHAVEWLDYDYLSVASGYEGNRDFSRKDADKVTVELYTPNKNSCKTLDGIKLDIYDYCTVYNNNISNLLDGKKKYPIGYFVSNCKGEYYNGMKIYLKLNDGLKDTYPDFRLYDLEIYDCNNNKTQLIDGPYTVSFYKDALDNAGGSLYIKSILDTYAKKDANGDIAVNFYDDVDSDAFSELSQDLSSLFRLRHSKFTFSNAAVDPFFIPQVDENILSQGDPDYDYHSYMAYTDDESVPEDQRSLRIQGDNNISTLKSLRLDEGFFLNGGSSGTLFDKRGNIIQSTYRQLLVQAFNGGLNPHVFDIRNYEFDVLMDAKFPKVVKISMVQLASSLRRDCIVCLDTDNMLTNNSGPATSAQAAIEARKSINTNDYAASIWCQNSVAYDEYSDRDIPVSATYFLSYKIPFNDKSNGIQTSFVGPRRGTMDLYKEISWYPTDDEKERLYKTQVNYISKDPRRIAFDSQLTSQVVTSALSNIPNVRVLFKIKRAVEKICDDYRFERNNGGTRTDMEDQVNEYLKTWINNGACETCTATVSATDYQIKQKMATVAIDVVFVGFLERIHIVINVNG